jgi:two-component system, LuxR family, response regulator FixJ
VIHVVEDDPAMRDALVLLLTSAGLEARGYASAEEFLAADEHTKPMCLLADIRLPGMNGLALHKHLVSLGAEPAVVMITGHGDIPMAVAALKAGALDFVTKPFDPALLLESVREALQRVDESRRQRARTEEVKGRLKTLTSRELAVLALLVQGDPNKVIAAKLGISVRTTEHHRARIMEKMAVRTLSQLIKVALGRVA